jgi:hypothetical protein
MEWSLPPHGVAGKLKGMYAIVLITISRLAAALQACMGSQIDNYIQYLNLQ